MPGCGLIVEFETLDQTWERSRTWKRAWIQTQLNTKNRHRSPAAVDTNNLHLVYAAKWNSLEKFTTIVVFFVVVLD